MLLAKSLRILVRAGEEWGGAGTLAVALVHLSRVLRETLAVALCIRQQDLGIRYLQNIQKLRLLF